MSREAVDTLRNLWRENILDDVNNAHTRIDEHLEQSDEWLSDFEQRTLTHAKLAMEMYHTVMDLKHTVNEQQIDILTTADAITIVEEGILTPMLARFIEMYHTVIELKQIVNEQQKQIEELQAIVNYCHNRHPSEVVAVGAFGF